MSKVEVHLTEEDLTRVFMLFAVAELIDNQRPEKGFKGVSTGSTAATRLARAAGVYVGIMEEVRAGRVVGDYYGDLVVAPGGGFTYRKEEP